MKKSIVLFSVIAAVIAVYSCNKTDSAKPSSTSAYLDLPAIPYTYAIAGDTDVAINQKATLGRVLFYDSHLSLNNAVSCGSCHKQAIGFADNVAFSTGYEGRTTKRNSQGIEGLAGNGLIFVNQGIVNPMFWDGREDVLLNLIARPVTNHVEMGVEDMNTLPQKLTALNYYNKLFNSAYGDSTITADRISESITDFISSITANNTRFDKYNDGNIGALNALELEGQDLFINKYNCAGCHQIFSDNYSSPEAAFRNIGLDVISADAGRGAITGATSDYGKFRVPSLKNVALTAPYMHDGRYKTLSEVIDHYSHNIENSANLDLALRDSATYQPISMNITDQEKQALIAFLNTLTDPTMVTDPRFSNPFKVK